MSRKIFVLAVLALAFVAISLIEGKPRCPLMSVNGAIVEQCSQSNPDTASKQPD